MKKIFCLLAAAALMCTCVKEKEAEQPGSIYGVVTDKATGEPIRAAGVQLSTGAKTVTGDDGQYEFAELKADDYTLQVSKTGYTDLVGYKITVEPNKEAKGDVQIEKLPPSLRVTGANGQDIDTLAFGSDVSVEERMFNIFNDGFESLEWLITENCTWITELSESSGTIPPGKPKPISVKIDREKLNGGGNVYILNIASDNGSKELHITAVGEVKILPTLNTLAASNVATSSATFNGEILNIGTPAYTERGFVYSLSSTPTLENTIAKVTVAVPVMLDDSSYYGDDLFYYSANVRGLTLGQTYYVRAYAVSSVGNAYSSNQVSFTPEALLPELGTHEVTMLNIGAGTATFNGTIINAGDPAYTERGFVYATTHTPTIGDNKKVVAGFGTGHYTLSVSDIAEGYIYRVRAYATNSKGTAYGDEVIFNFEAAAPELSTQAVSDINIGAGTATFHGTIISAGDLPVTERGFVYATTHNPTTANTKITATGTGTGIYSANVSDISEGHTYYIRAYVLNAKGAVYGEEVSLNFEAAAPEVSTQAVSDKNIGAGTATFHGTLISAGDMPITERGFVYATTNNPTISNTKVLVAGSGTGIYSENITGLEEGKVYYVRAFATNSKTTVYGTQVSVDFNAVMPVPDVQAATGISTTSATLHGSITSVGDPAYTEKGFVYGTSINPSIENGTKEVVAGSGAGAFSKTPSGLTEGTTYYVRSYATYPNGTVYSTTSQSFSTLLTLTGTVENEQTSVGINGATVLIKQGSTTLGQATTNNSGDFSIANMAFGSYTVMATAAGYTDNTTTVTLSSTQKTASITLSPLGKISGTLKDDDGFAIKNVNVELHQNSIRQQTAVTNTNGEFTFSNLTPGTYSIVASVDNHENLNAPITVVSGDNAKDYTMKITVPFAFDPGTLDASFIPAWGEVAMILYYEGGAGTPGTTGTKIVRIKNNRQKSVSWSLTDVPPDGITFSTKSGTVAANGVVSITATFTYPNATGGSTQVGLSECAVNSVFHTKTYLWNWSEKGTGYYYSASIDEFIQNNCGAYCLHNPLITVGEHSDRFSIIFSQLTVWK